VSYSLGASESYFHTLAFTRTDGRLPDLQEMGALGRVDNIWGLFVRRVTPFAFLYPQSIHPCIAMR
jgi:hypothetical protein